jgi:hypothetical protein
MPVNLGILHYLLHLRFLEKRAILEKGAILEEILLSIAV